MGVGYPPPRIHRHACFILSDLGIAEIASRSVLCLAQPPLGADELGALNVLAGLQHPPGQSVPESIGMQGEAEGRQMEKVKIAPRLSASLLLMGLGVSAILAATPSVVLASQSATSVSPRTVPINCAAQGIPDNRTVYDASVQPDVIVPDFSGFPFSPTTYTATYFDAQTQSANPVANFHEIDTTDHLVSAWGNSTDCFGAAGGTGNGDESRNHWIADSTGHVFGMDNLPGPAADNFGDASGLPLNKPVVGMTPTSDGEGYWLVASDGGIFNYGDAGFFGSAGSIHLNKPIVGMSVSPGGQGYTLVASDGGVFNYGDSHFYGSLPGVLKPGQVLNSPIEGIVNTPDGGGYWMVAADGGIFTFGDAPFLGSLGSEHLASPIAGMFANGNGYTLVAQDGTLYPFA